MHIRTCFNDCALGLISNGVRSGGGAHRRFDQTTDRIAMHTCRAVVTSLAGCDDIVNATHQPKSCAFGTLQHTRWLAMAGCGTATHVATKA